MMISRARKVGILIVVFVILGLTVIFFTDKPRSFGVRHQNPSEAAMVSSSDDYIQTINPWLNSALSDSSPTNISEIRNKFLNLRSADQSIGEAHLHLFLAFDAWHNFLKNNDTSFKEQAMDNFSTVIKLWPDLKSYIEKLQVILQNA